MNTHNELFARFVAYSSPYLFWVCVGVVVGRNPVAAVERPQFDSASRS